MSTYTTEVICLRTLDFGEKDKILHLYSPEVGKISAIAKGVKGTKSKLAGACNPLQISQVQLTQGKNLDVLCQYQSLEAFFKLHQDILKLAFATLFAEEVSLLSSAHDEDSQTIFHLLKETLIQLEATPEASVVQIATNFQMRLLRLSGYEPLLDRCMGCEEEIASDVLYYSFSADLGGILCSSCRHEAAYVTSVVNVSTTTLQALYSPLKVDWQAVSPLKVQKFLKYYFSYKLEKQLRAYDFVLSLLESKTIF